MLQSKSLLRTGLLAFPVNECLIHNAPTPSHYGEDFSSRSPSYSKDSDIDEVAITVTEISSNTSNSLNTILRLGNFLNFRWIVSAKYILLYSMDNHSSRVYSLMSNQWVTESVNYLRNQAPSNKRLSTYCQPKAHSNYFILCFEDNTIQTVLIHASNQSDTPIMRLSPLFSLGKLLHSQKIKEKGKILSITSHPTLPILFFSFSDGQVLVLSYERNYRTMAQNQFEQSSGRQEELPSDGDDLLDEEAEEPSEDRLPDKGFQESHRRNSGRGLFDRGTTKLQSKILFTWVGYLELPSSQYLAQMDDQLGSLSLVCSDCKISFDGQLAAIIFSNAVLMLYDLLPLRSEFTFSSSSSGSISFRYVSCFPLHAPPANLLKQNPYDPTIEYKLQSCCFHPHLPLLFLAVLRRKAYPRVFLQTSSAGNHRHPSASTAATPFYVPIDPMIYAIPLLKTTTFLGAIGSYELDLLSKLPGLNHRMASLNYAMDFMDCTPVTGVLTFLFRINTAMQHNLTQVSSAKDFSQEQLFYTLSVSEQWKFHQGITFFDGVVANSLPIPAEVYCFGLTALSRFATFQQNAKDTKKEAFQSLERYKCQLKVPSTRASSSADVTAVERNGLPPVFLLRQRESTGECLALAMRNIEVHEIDYLSLLFSQQSSAHQRCKLVCEIPMLLTAENIKGAIRRTYKWLKLDKEHYWLPPSSPGESIDILGDLATKYQRRNSKMISSDKEYCFTPVQLEVWNLPETAPVGTVIAIEAVIRTLSENSVMNVLPSEAINSLGEGQVESIVCLVNPRHSNDSTNEWTIISCRSVIYVGDDTVLALGLDREGKHLKVFQFGTSSGGDVSSIVIKTVLPLSESVLRLWYNGANGTVYFLTTDNRLVSCLLADLNGAVSAGAVPLAPLSWKNELLSFFADEEIESMCFQPKSHLLDEGGNSISELERTMKWCSLGEVGSVFAILTSQRLLVVRDSLKFEVLDVLYHNCSRSLPSLTGSMDSSPTQHLNSALASCIDSLHAGIHQRKQTTASGAQHVFESSMKRTAANSLLDRIKEITFVGGALTFFSDGGSLLYYTPRDSSSRRMKMTSSSKMFQRAVGRSSFSALSPNPSLLGKLVSLPRNLSPHYPTSPRVLAVFPDRLMIVFGDRMPRFNSIRFHSSIFPALSFRPLNPFEPILNALLMKQRSVVANRLTDTASGDFLSELKDLVSHLIAHYAPLLPNDVFTSSGSHVQRFVPSKHLMASLAFSWEVSRQQLPNIQDFPVAAFAHTLLLPSNRLVTKNSELFPSGRSISPGVRALWQLLSAEERGSSATRFSDHVLEVLMGSNRSVLVDVIAGSETFGGSHFPARGSAFSRRLSALAHLLIELKSRGGQQSWEEDEVIFVTKLLDIAGDYSSIFSWFSREEFPSQGDRSKLILSVVQDFERHLTQLLPKEIAGLLSYARDECHEREEFRRIEEYLMSNVVVSISNISKAKRNKSLFSSLLEVAKNSRRVSRVGSKRSSPSVGLDVEALTKSCLAVFQRFGGIIGPYWSDFNVFPLKICALDVLEEFMGTQQSLETIEGSSSLFGAMDGSGGGEGSSSTSLFFKEQLQLPPRWTENVGTGRELDKVSAYYRFSDVFYPSEPGFVSTALPNSRLTFIDLSRFEGPGLELFSSDSAVHQFSVDHSQSNINAGERHESTKALCDVSHSYLLSSSGKPRADSSFTSGLRSVIFRGAPLDIGCYHLDQRRNKLTLELHLSLMNSSRDSLRERLRQSGQSLVIAERRGEDDSSSMWRFSLEVDGSLSVAMGANAKISTEKSFDFFEFIDRKSGGTIEEEENDSNADFSSFLHFVLILDGSATICDCHAVQTDPPDFLLSHSASISVSVFVEGEKLIDNRSTLRPPDMRESQLEKSHLFFLPNAAVSYRLTEVRLWSDVRSPQELSDQKDNYLLLAEKRYRLQMQLKGTRKLFGPYRDVIVGEASEGLVEPSSVGEAKAASSIASKAPGAIGGHRFSLASPSLALPPVTDISQADGKAGGGGLHAPPTAANTALSARQRRLSALKDGSSAASTVKTSTTTNSSPFAPFGSSTENSSNTSHKKTSLASSSVLTSRPENLSLSTTKAVVLSQRFAHWNDEVFLESLTSRQSKFLCPPVALGILRDHRIEMVSSQRSQQHLLTWSATTIPLPTDLHHLKSGDSLCFALRSRDNPQSYRLAICSQRSLEIANLTLAASPTLEKVVSLPLPSTPLAYFYFLTPELMILVTPTEAFTWKPLLKDDSKSRFDPIRILHRVDLSDTKSWQQRTVLEVAVSPERWTLLLTCRNRLSLSSPPFPEGVLNLDEAIERAKETVVSVHHTKSGKSLSFRAISATFRSPGQLLLLFLVSSEDKNACHFRLVALNLADVLDFASSGAIEARHPSFASNSHYLTPLEYSDLNCLQYLSTDGVAEEIPSKKDSEALKGLWSIALDSECIRPSSLSGKRPLFGVETPIASVFHLNDKVLVLFSSGSLVVVGTNPLGVEGQTYLFPEEDERVIVSSVIDTIDLEHPTLLGLVRSPTGLQVVEVLVQELLDNISRSKRTSQK